MKKTIDFEEAVVKNFGHVKDLTLAAAIAKRFFYEGFNCNKKTQILEVPDNERHSLEYLEGYFNGVTTQQKLDEKFSDDASSFEKDKLLRTIWRDARKEMPDNDLKPILYHVVGGLWEIGCLQTAKENGHTIDGWAYFSDFRPK